MEELDLKDLLDLFWNKKVHILLIVLVFMMLGIIYTVGFTTPMYSSSTTLVLASSGNTISNPTNTITATDITVNSKLVSTYREIVRSKNTLRQVISNLGINVEEDYLRKNTTVSSVKDTELIEITVRTENPEYSAKIANEIAEVFTEDIKDIYNIENVQIWDRAEVENHPSNINHKKDILLFIFIGLVISAGYVLIANMLDTTVKSVEDIEKGFNVPVLAAIPVYEIELQKSKRKKGGKRK